MTNSMHLEGSRCCREVQRRIRQAEEDALEASPSICHPWHSLQEVLIIGLGSVEHSTASRYQLALILLLAESLSDLRGPLQIRDPVLSKTDKDVLRKCQCQILDTDAEAFKTTQSPTLLFMPHCAASLFHNLLVKNWSSEGLARLVILGNGLERMTAHWAELPAKLRKERPKPEGILRLVQANAVVDVPIHECDFPIRGAFNDFSVCYIPGQLDDWSALEALSTDHLLPGGI